MAEDKQAARLIRTAEEAEKLHQAGKLHGPAEVILQSPDKAAKPQIQKTLRWSSAAPVEPAGTGVSALPIEESQWLAPLWDAYDEKRASPYTEAEVLARGYARGSHVWNVAMSCQTN